MPVDRIPGQRQVLAHPIELDALDKHLAGAHGHHMPALEGLFRVGRCLELDIARQQTDFATFIHVEGDLAEVHVVQFLVERDRIALDGGNGAPLGLPGIEIRGREDNLVTGSPARRVQDLDGGAAGRGGLGQLGPGVLPVAVQVQGSAHDHDSAVTHTLHGLFIRDGVGEGNRRLARVGAGLGADFQFPMQHDPLGGQFKVGSVGEAEFAVDRQTAQRRRSDVEDDVLARGNGDLVTGAGHASVWPGGSIRPARLPGRRRSSILSLNDSEYADEQECWQEQSKKERAMVRTHESTLLLDDDREPQRQSGARSGAQQTSNPGRIADFRGSAGMRLPPAPVSDRFQRAMRQPPPAFMSGGWCAR